MKRLLTVILLTAASSALAVVPGHTKGREVAPFSPEFKPGDYVWKPEVSPVTAHLSIASEFIAHLRTAITPGATLIITDLPVSRQTRSSSGYGILTAAR